MRGQSDPELKKYLWVVIRTQKDRKIQTLIEVCMDFASLCPSVNFHRPAEQAFAIEEDDESEEMFAMMDRSQWTGQGISEPVIPPSLLQMFDVYHGPASMRRWVASHAPLWPFGPEISGLGRHATTPIGRRPTSLFWSVPHTRVYIDWSHQRGGTRDRYGRWVTYSAGCHLRRWRKRKSVLLRCRPVVRLSLVTARGLHRSRWWRKKRGTPGSVSTIDGSTVRLSRTPSPFPELTILWICWPVYSGSLLWTWRAVIGKFHCHRKLKSRRRLRRILGCFSSRSCRSDCAMHRPHSRD